MDELRAWLTLSRAPGVYAGTIAQLRAEKLSLPNIVAAAPRTLADAGLSSAAIAALLRPDSIGIDNDLRWLERPGNAFIACDSPDYPPLLHQLSDAPAGVFVRGQIAALAMPQLAMVGSRNPTASGRETAASFASHLAKYGLAITSGLAVGIDAASHEGTLRGGGTTIAVCATGLDVVYPRAHEKLAAAIVERGALISEFPPDTTVKKFHFPRRNRIISGLALGTLVVEAAARSGSLITAKFAADQGREVFAIPGSIHNPMSRGCHQLLRQGAKLVESVEDILAELGPLAAVIFDAAVPNRGARPTSDAREPLDNDYKMLLDALGFDPAGIDQLVERSGLRPEAVASMLLILELNGHIESMPGALYVRVSQP